MGLWFRLAAGEPAPLVAVGAEPELPDVETVLREIVRRDSDASGPRRDFDAHFAYTVRRIRTERNAKGVVRHQEEKEEPHTPAADAASAVGKKEAARRRKADDEEVNLRLNDELLRRFDWTMRGRERVGGRVLLRLDFQPPAVEKPVRGLVDRFLNRTAGILWVDATNYAVMRGEFRLTEEVSFFYGIGGVVFALEGSFDLESPEEGFFYVRETRWRVDYREFLTRKLVDYEEQRSNVRRVR